MSTRDDIIQKAKKLFLTQGYDLTSTNQIVDELAISRGALYHHFKSKEDILNEVIQELCQSLIHRAKSQAMDRQKPLIQRMIAFFQALDFKAVGGQDLLDQMHQPANALMEQQANLILYQEIPPLLAHLIEEGCQEGIFQVNYPLETAQMIIAYLTTAFDFRQGSALESEEDKLKTLIDLLERLLGITDSNLADILSQVDET